MIDALKEMLSFPFMMRALIAGPLIALCLSLLGVSLVLKRYSMIGDGLSHVAFGAIALASALHTAPLFVGIPVVMISSIFLLKISENSKLNGDSAVALISTSALAIGVTAISMSKGMNIDVWNYLFGSVLSLKRADVYVSLVLAFATLMIYVLFYNKIFATTFDENFAAAIGANTKFYNLLIAILTSLVIVIGMRMVGSLLISSLVVFPAMSAMRVVKNFRAVVLLSGFLAVLCTSVGLVVSYFVETPAGASIVICNLIVFLLLSLYEYISVKRSRG